MSWTRQSGNWSRPLGCHDRLFQFIGDSGKPLGREHWVMIGAVHLVLPAGMDIVAQLRTAWKTLRLRHPDIAHELHQDEKHTTRSVALVGSHWRWDGLGLIMVLHGLLAKLENPTPLPTVFDGSEAQHLIPSLDIAIGMPSIRDPNWDRRADELISTYLNGQFSIGLLPDSKLSTPVLPGNTHRVNLRVPAKDTLALCEACRAQGITLTTAIHDSAVCSNASSPATRYISWQAFDLRKYCPPPFNGPIHGPSLRMVGLPANVEARAPWDKLVRAIHLVYAQSWGLS
ncbi:uncharacterized protein BDV17DRAFT_295227 [Aspergillus undulatus]|uniref:uncharacterized protein n=1 Tax=Aspergillus undulatus TaxID=1810928 RepID=UPI003CCE3874